MIWKARKDVQINIQWTEVHVLLCLNDLNHSWNCIESSCPLFLETHLRKSEASEKSLLSPEQYVPKKGKYGKTHYQCVLLPCINF